MLVIIDELWSMSPLRWRLSIYWRIIRENIDEVHGELGETAADHG